MHVTWFLVVIGTVRTSDPSKSSHRKIPMSWLQEICGRSKAFRLEHRDLIDEELWRDYPELKTLHNLANEAADSSANAMRFLRDRISKGRSPKIPRKLFNEVLDNSKRTLQEAQRVTHNAAFQRDRQEGRGRSGRRSAREARALYLKSCVYHVVVMAILANPDHQPYLWEYQADLDAENFPDVLIVDDSRTLERTMLRDPTLANILPHPTAVPEHYVPQTLGVTPKPLYVRNPNPYGHPIVANASADLGESSTYQCKQVELESYLRVKIVFLTYLQLIDLTTLTWEEPIRSTGKTQPHQLVATIPVPVRVSQQTGTIDNRLLSSKKKKKRKATYIWGIGVQRRGGGRVR
jgi:hypothetical protein